MNLGSSMEFRQEDRKRNDDFNEDYPPFSRLFIVCGKDITEDDLRNEFSKFGTIEDIRIPRNHSTNEHKGVAFMKYSKTSEAAMALECMHQKKIASTTRPIKVIIAAQRSEIVDGDKSGHAYKRLFVFANKSATEKDLTNHFQQFGRLESLSIMRDRNTNESKGFAYITFTKFSDAAKAFEECDRMYSPKFAEPKSSKQRQTKFESDINSLEETSSNLRNSVAALMDVRPDCYTRLFIMCSPVLTNYHVKMLFDIVPGMINCEYAVDLYRKFGKGCITYSNPASATYAFQRLNNFEYPLGQRIMLKPDYSYSDPAANPNNIPFAYNNLKQAMGSGTSSTTPDLAKLAEAIAQASKLVKSVTQGVSNIDVPDVDKSSYCSVELPPQKPLADINSPIVKRCFLVCKPQPPPLTVLRDIFCRFGDLINVYTLPNKTVGYACYSSTEAADAAIKTLHGAEVCGIRMKVLVADDDDRGNKRRRYD